MRVRALVVVMLLMCLLGSCSHVDNRRLPAANVYLVFWTQADWVTYGVSGAGSHKRYIKSERIPSDFPYSATSATGYGGLLVCTSYNGDPLAYDLACPVECRGDVRVFINEDNLAECPKCHSCFDVFMQYGAPVSGEAAEKGYGMQLYNVTGGRSGEYLVIYN